MPDGFRDSGPIPVLLFACTVLLTARIYMT